MHSYTYFKIHKNKLIVFNLNFITIFKQFLISLYCMLGLFPPFFFSLKHMLTKPSYYSLSPSPERRGSPLGYHPTLGHQVTKLRTKLTISQCGPTRQPSQRKGIQCHGTETKSLSNCYGTHMKTKLHICYKYVGCRCSAPTCSLVGG